MVPTYARKFRSRELNKTAFTETEHKKITQRFANISDVYFSCLSLYIMTTTLFSIFFSAKVLFLFIYLIFLNALFRFSFARSFVVSYFFVRMSFEIARFSSFEKCLFIYELCGVLASLLCVASHYCFTLSPFKSFHWQFKTNAFANH